VLSKLKGDEAEGLSEQEAAARLDTYGPNELVERGGKSSWNILLDQFKDTMVVILIIAAIISIVLQEYTDAVAIIVIVIINALIGFRQEYKAEEAMAALKKLAVPTVKVRRGGRVLEISAPNLVPGDIVLLEAGNVVPADCRLIESVNLQTQEAALTGESEPVNKYIDPIEVVNPPLAERLNMVYMGTVVTYGRGRAVVTETGMGTELGNIADLMQAAGEELTPLQKRLDQLGKGLAFVAIILVGIVFLLGYLRGEDWETLLLTGISLAVAAIPEGLPAVVTIALALGARRMLGREALIRKLPAVEALGSVTVICSDKTGTLTENRMTVTVLDVANQRRIDFTEELTKTPRGNVYMPCIATSPDEEQAQRLQGNPALTLLLAGGSLCNDAIIECDDVREERFHIVGDPTEGALAVAAARMGLGREALESISPRVGEIPFDSERKRMTTVNKVPASLGDIPKEFLPIWDWRGWINEFEYVAFTKGAVDELLAISSEVWVKDQAVPINQEWIERIEKANSLLAEEGMRVLGVACRSVEELPRQDNGYNLEQELIFVGLVGMIDPARPEVRDAVQTCKTAGIRPIMITGDHPLTARHIAEELGITTDGEVLTGNELEGMSPEKLEESVEEVSVYARVTPEHKLRIVNALQSQGQIAAMTGDGVNDAPALKTADIGVAMGITGTDVSKEASDMVLLDDNFATIVAAVEEGRVIYDNIRKFIKYTLSSNMGEILVMLVAPFLGMPLPLFPLQILWINLVTDGLPGLALSVEKAERETMRRPPYPPNENIFARGVGRDIIWVGTLIGFLSIAVGYWYWRNDLVTWQTMVFTTLTLSEMGFVMAIRSNRDSLFSIGVFSNRSLIGAVLLTIALQMAVIYVPFLQNLFSTVALPLSDLAICFGLSILVFLVVEFQKWVSRRLRPDPVLA
jgi:Ca2+-transporting ATPase